MERAEHSGGLHKRSAEAWGDSLRARGGGAPIGACLLHECASAHMIHLRSSGLENIPVEMGADDAKRSSEEEDILSKMQKVQAAFIQRLIGSIERERIKMKI